MPKDVVSSLGSLMPSPILEILMKSIASHSYDRNKYNEVYQRQNALTKFERFALSTYIKTLSCDNPHIMDVGCGAGIPFDLYFVNRGCKITGIDVSKNQIRRAMSNIPSAEFVNMDFLKYHDTFLYDGVVLLYSLFHIQREYHSIVMQKIYDLLMPRGKVLLNIRKEDCGKFKFRKDFCGKPMCWSHYDSNTFFSIIQRIGFTYDIIGDEKSYGSSESHLWLILSK